MTTEKRAEELLRAARAEIHRSWALAFVNEIYDDGYADGIGQTGVEDIVSALSARIRTLEQESATLTAKIEALEYDKSRMVLMTVAENECRVSAARMKRLAAGLAESDGPTALSEAIYEIPIPPNAFQ